MISYEAVAIGVAITGLVFLFNERKKIKGLFSKKNNSSIPNNEIERIMKEKNISFSEAKDVLVNKEVVNAINISKKEWDLGNGLILKQGDRVSFVDEEVGHIQGDFFGLIEPRAVGYGDLYILKKPDNTFRQAPVAYIKKDTVNIYR